MMKPRQPPRLALELLVQPLVCKERLLERDRVIESLVYRLVHSPHSAISLSLPGQRRLWYILIQTI